MCIRDSYSKCVDHHHHYPTINHLHLDCLEHLLIWLIQQQHLSDLDVLEHLGHLHHQQIQQHLVHL